MTEAHEGTRGNEATMWTDEAMHAAYKEAFDKDPDAHHWALLSWIRDDMQQALAAEHAAALERVKELEEMLSVERQAYSDSATRQRDFYIAALVKRDIHIRELKAQLAERSEYEWTPVAGSLEWGTIEVALKNERAALCGCDACKLGRDSIDAALAFVREQRRVPTERTPVAATTQGQPMPDWTQAPTWAQWWAVDANGQSMWYRVEPYCDDDEGACWCGQFDDKGDYDSGMFCERHTTLPLGIDWRTTLTQRPQPWDAKEGDEDDGST